MSENRFRPLPQPWRLLYQLWYFLVAAPLSLGLLTPLLGGVTYLVSFFNQRASVRVGILWARLILWLTLIRVRCSGCQSIDPKRSYVVVVNHLSVLDILAIYGYLPVDFRWVMKQEIRKIPVIGGGCYRMGHIYIDRSNRQKAIASLQAAREQLVDGISILFFPEGTRSRTGEMLPFKKGAFRMAIDLQLPLLPVTLRNTGKLMPRGSLSPLPGTIELVIHPEIPVHGLTTDDLPALMKKARAAIQSGLER